VSKPTLMDRLRYRFDNFFSRGTLALIAGLGVLSFIVIIVAALIIVILNIRPEGVDAPLTFHEAAWESMMRTLDAGTMGGDAGWSFRLVMFGVTLGGVFFISTLIGILTSGIESKMDELRKGRSKVIENGHTVILGWSSQIFSVISELSIANENQKDACIVILAPRDKLEMEDEIKEKVSLSGKTRIVCRTGNPIDLDDLAIASLPTSKSIILLSPESEYPDADVIKTMVAVLNRADRRKEPYHIVAEIRDPKNVYVARIVGKDEVELVLVGDLIARILAQTCLQSGLSVVYTELLDFGGDEIYFKEEPSLVGKTYAEVLFDYETSAVIGIKPRSGMPSLNPAMETVLQPGDQIIAISEDDDTILLTRDGSTSVQTGLIREAAHSAPGPQNILILGWNQDGPAIVHEIDYYVSDGSQILVAASIEDAEEEILACSVNAHHLNVKYRFGETSDRRMLESLDLNSFDHIILLAYSDTMDAQRADANALVSLLHLRDLADRNGYDYAIVSQIIDERNRALAEVTRADDFIVSDRLASLMVSQVAENKYLNAVFADIFDPEGSEIYLKPAGDYIMIGEAVNFYTVVESARRRGETACGYRIKAKAKDAAQGYGVVVNPTKSQKITFAQDDKVIVLAED
jgi:ion channel POLLUX/CASTOR